MRIIGIDASNLLEGGGVTHLQELLFYSNPTKYNFEKIIVWGSKKTLNKISNVEWIEKKTNFFLNQNLFFRLFWRVFLIKYELKKSNCKILFSPGGSDSSGFKPMVTMCRNMLPFEREEALSFGIGLKSFKFLLLNHFQSKSFLKSNGLIFLTNYASEKVSAKLPILKNKSIIIPHGISNRFFIKPRKQKEEYSQKDKCKIIYVSKTDPYKHHINLIKAINLLYQKKYHIELILIGPRGSSAKEVENLICELDPQNSFINYLGGVSYEYLNTHYHSADIAVFASSCENMPNILLESMASGLPIACSNKGPMPEILGENAIYFNPNSIHEIFIAISKLIDSSKLREDLALKSYLLAKSYSWEISANKTFSYLNKTLITYKNF